MLTEPLGRPIVFRAASAEARTDALPTTYSLTPQQMALAQFLSDYYQAPLGIVLELLQPPPPSVVREGGVSIVRITPAGRALTMAPRAKLQHALHRKLVDGLPHSAAELKK